MFVEMLGVVLWLLMQVQVRSVYMVFFGMSVVRVPSNDEITYWIAREDRSSPLSGDPFQHGA